MNYSDPHAFLGVGFRFPIQVDEMTGRMKTASYEEDIVEAIHIILMTRKGERIMHPEFGCGIHEYQFSEMEYTTLKLMEGEVKQALMMWEPRIIDVEAVVEAGKEAGCLLIRIAYVVRTTNNPYNLVYPYYLYEGMEKGTGIE